MRRGTAAAPTACSRPGRGGLRRLLAEQALVAMARAARPAESACRSSAAGPGSLPGADRGDRRHPADPRVVGAGRERGALLAAERPGRTACAAHGPGPPRRRAGPASDNQRAGLRLRGCGARPACRASWPGVAEASMPPAPWRFAVMLLDPPRDALRRRDRRCAGGRCWTRGLSSGKLPTLSGARPRPRLAGDGAPMGCRNSSRIWPGAWTLRPRVRGRSSVTPRQLREAAGDLVPASGLAARARRIGSMPRFAPGLAFSQK